MTAISIRATTHPITRRRAGIGLGFGALYLAPFAAAAQDELNNANTAWMLVASVLVLLMTIPGLALFYAGMVRSKNVLSVLMQCFSIAALVSILWAIVGYSLAFSGTGNWIGDLSKAFLRGVSADSLHESIPETVFITYQMNFAIVTPALIVGAFAERMKYSAMMMFMAIWLILCYAPVCHWVWGGGWLERRGILDFAGGTVVHVNAGVAGLAACLALGPRSGYGRVQMPPNNLAYTLVGASLMWIGWFGFNAGGALAANATAGMAMLVTQLSTATAALVWTFVEWAKHGKPSVLGVASGAIAGLVAITPASGHVGPMGAIAIGAITAPICFVAATGLKMMLRYDDSLDVFGIHAVAGMVGAILAGVFCATSLGGTGFADGITTIKDQVTAQGLGVAATALYTFIVSFVVLKILDVVMGLRVTQEQEEEGLDLALHDERGYIL